MTLLPAPNHCVNPTFCGGVYRNIARTYCTFQFKNHTSTVHTHPIYIIYTSHHTSHVTFIIYLYIYIYNNYIYNNIYI